ncbi:MAG: hypothetical protein LBU88_02430 [Treponema sp.]|jgi:hypothetical protein|nr:hypothetical protein [Treponema sp.]
MYNKKNLKKETLEKETLNYNIIENIFFDNIKKGKIPYKILNIYTPFDLMMIKSLFISENIPYYVEFEYLMKVQPFMHGLNYNNVNLYILEEDYNDAMIVIKNYLKTKNTEKYKIKKILRNVVEMVFFNYTAPNPNIYLGIDIYYKK